MNTIIFCLLITLVSSNINLRKISDQPCGLYNNYTAIFSDMHDGDQKIVQLQDGIIKIFPYPNSDTWSTQANFDFNHCNATIDFNVPNKPAHPPINLTATFYQLNAPGYPSKIAVIFNDYTETLAPSDTSLNAWIQNKII